MRKIIVSGLAAVAAIAGLAVPAAAGAAPTAALPGVVRAVPAAVSSGLAFMGNRISCGTAKSCLVAGANTNNSTGNATPLVRAWNGSAWRGITVHAPKGTTFQGMSGVSCKSATYCLVIGEDMSNGTSGAIRPFALTWNGTAVSAMPAPPVPSGAMETTLADVTCVAVKSCVAAGTSISNSGATKWVVETWNGSRWTLHTMAPGGGLQPGASDMSCVSLSYCVLAGASSTSAGAIRPLLAAWNGKTVSLMKVPVPAGYASPLMLGVSCASASDCAAVGDNFVISSNTTKLTAFTENWNGKAWTATRWAWPKGTTISLLTGISCTYSKTAGRHCIAVGAAGTQSTANPVALGWNGTKWSAQQVPGPGKGKSTVLEGISCLSATHCVATGETGASSGTTSSPVAGFWNGTAWRVAAA